MKKNVKPFIAMALMAAAAEASDPYFMSARRYRQQRNDAIRKRREDDAAMRALVREYQKEYEFSIHGEKIMAKSRKDAIRKYNARHRK